MFLQENELSLMQPDAFPDTVTGQVATIKDRDTGLITGNELSVNPDLDLFVARIMYGIVSTSRRVMPGLGIQW